MNKLLSYVIAALFAAACVNAFAASHAGEAKDDKKMEKKSEMKTGEMKKAGMKKAGMKKSEMKKSETKKGAMKKDAKTGRTEMTKEIAKEEKK